MFDLAVLSKLFSANKTQLISSLFARIGRRKTDFLWFALVVLLLLGESFTTCS